LLNPPPEQNSWVDHCMEGIWRGMNFACKVPFVEGVLRGRNLAWNVSCVEGILCGRYFVWKVSRPYRRDRLSRL